MEFNMVHDLGNIRINIRQDGAVQGFDAHLATLRNADATEQEKAQAKTGLKAFGIDVDNMKIFKIGEPTKTHKVTLYAAKFGKDVEVEANVLLPHDADKAAFLYAQAQIYFPVLAKQSSPHIYEANLSYQMKLSGTGGETQLELQNLKVTKFKPHEGFTGWFKNWGMEESWTPAHLQQLTGTPGYSYQSHEKYLRTAKAGIGLMPLSQARIQIYTPAIRQAIDKREGARGVGAPPPNDVKSFGQIQSIPGLTLPEAPKKLLALLVEAETQAGLHANDLFATDDKLNELMKAVEECKDFGLKWNMTDKSDYTADRRDANPEKIDSLVEYLKDFADYCQIQADLTKVADLKTLKKESETLKSTREKLSNLKDDEDEALDDLAEQLQEIKDIRNENQLEVEEDDDENVTLQDKLDAQKDALRRLNQLDTKYKPYFEVQALLDKQEAAQTAFDAALLKLCPQHGTNNYEGLVRPKELNTAIGALAVININKDAFDAKKAKIDKYKEKIGKNIAELQEAIAAQQP